MQEHVVAQKLAPILDLLGIRVGCLNEIYHLEAKRIPAYFRSLVKHAESNAEGSHIAEMTWIECQVGEQILVAW